MSQQDFKFKTLYGQIILGISPAKIDGSVAFIRHLSPLEQGELDGGYSSFFEKAVERELPTEEQKLKQLAADNLWTDADESFVENQERYLIGLKDSKKNLLLPSQVEEQNKTIAATEALLLKKRGERTGLLQLTAESYARKKVNELYICKSLFRDKRCTEPFFDDDVFEYLDTNEINRVAIAFNETMANMNEQAIKQIAIAPFFQNSFGLCDDNIFNFYGKPIVHLTFLQSDLAGYGRFFKHILSSEPKPPGDIINDPDKIIDWYQTAKNAEKMMKQNNSSNVAVVGATQDDMKALSQASGGEIVTLEKLAGGRKKVRGAELAKMLS